MNTNKLFSILNIIEHHLNLLEINFLLIEKLVFTSCYQALYLFLHAQS